MELEFDELGYLKPHQIIRCDLESVKEYFVTAFPVSKTRHQLWESYLQYVQDLQNKVTPHFIQWLDGSFLTKKHDPKDIDIVTFIDSEVFKAKESVLEKYWSFALEPQGLDAYFVEVYHRTDSRYEIITENYRTIWKERFGKDRLGQVKGFLEINW